MKVNACSDEVYFFVKAESGADPCAPYDSCEECPYYDREKENDEY